MKAIAVKSNSKGIRYALVTDGVTFSVYVERKNYCRHDAKMRQAGRKRRTMENAGQRGFFGDES